MTNKKEMDKDYKRNLCDTCKFTFPNCHSRHIVLGTGIGNDNVYRCRKYTKAIPVISIEELKQQMTVHHSHY